MTGHVKRCRVIITCWVNFFNFDLTSLADNREVTDGAALGNLGNIIIANNQLPLKNNETNI